MCALFYLQIRDSDTPGLEPVLNGSSTQRVVVTSIRALVRLGIVTLEIRDGLTRGAEAVDKTSGTVAEMG